MIKIVVYYHDYWYMIKERQNKRWQKAIKWMGLCWSRGENVTSIYELNGKASRLHKPI